MKSPLRHPVTCRAIAIRLLAPALLIASTAQSGMATFISITPTTSTLAAGGSETITVQLTSTQDFTLQSLSLVLDFDSTRFTTSNVAKGSSLFGSGTITQA